MKALGLIISCLLISFVGRSQSLLDTTISIDNIQLNGLYYAESDNPRKWLVGLRDEYDDRWNSVTWGQELIPFAEKNGWGLFIPNQLNTQNLSIFNHLITADSTKIQTFFMANGAAAELALTMTSAGIPGLLVYPDTVQALLELPLPIHLALIDAKSTPWLLADSVLMAGVWLNELMTEKLDDYYMDNHYEVYDRMLRWVDSTQNFLHNETLFNEWVSGEGVLTNLPEVTRQGKPLEIEIRLAEPKPIQIQLLNLSAESVWSQSMFYGVGEHSIVIPTKDLPWGVYTIEVKGKDLLSRSKTMIRG